MLPNSTCIIILHVLVGMASRAVVITWLKMAQKGKLLFLEASKVFSCVFFHTTRSVDHC